MLRNLQKLYCPCCGSEHRADVEMRMATSLCCSQDCQQELGWRYTLSIMGREYYPNPVGTGRWKSTYAADPGACRHAAAAPIGGTGDASDWLLCPDCGRRWRP